MENYNRVMPVAGFENVVHDTPVNNVPKITSITDLK